MYKIKRYLLYSIKMISVFFILMLFPFTAHADEYIPSVGFVGIMDNPAVYGQEQILTFTSKEYKGDVQYKVFYIQRDEDVKIDAKNWKVLCDWTEPAPADSPVAVRVPAYLADKPRRYDFAVRVKRARTDGTKPNQLGGYDDAYLFRYVFSATPSSYLDYLNINKKEVKIGEKVTITGSQGVNYRLFTFKEGRGQRWDKTPRSNGSKVEWIPDEEGEYIFDVQVMKGNKVAGWKLFNVTVTDVLRVSSIDGNSSIKTGDIRYNTPGNKEWTVYFTREIDKNTINSSNIKVYDKNTNENIPVEFTIGNSMKDIKIKPIRAYTSDHTYALEISDRVKSKDGLENTKPFKLYFSVVNNVFAGLPAEDGIVIIDDVAYSSLYLYENSAVVNQIVSRGYYDIYYIYDEGYQNIKSLFDLSSYTGKTYIRKYNTMTYVDREGKRHTYKWDYNRNEYIEELPAADIVIITRSDIKMVNVTVNQIYGIPDAVYYRVQSSNDYKMKYEKSIFTTNNGTEKIYFYDYNKQPIAYGFIYVTYDHTRKYLLNIDYESGKGNSAANINNNGFAAMDEDGYIYYSNPIDKEKLYRMNYDGMLNRKISDDKAQYINVSNGWIYYSNYYDGGKLYKVRTDGSGRTKILDDKAAYITLTRNDIFYSNHSDGGKLYRIKKDGTDVITRLDGTCTGNKYINNDNEVAYLNIVGDWIYYSNYSDGNKISIINKEGIYKGKVVDEWAKCPEVEGDWIYFSSGSGVINKVKKNGKGEVIPIKAQTKEFNKGYHFNVYGDWVFYSNYDDGGKLYKVKTDGSGDKIKLADEPVGYINILGDYVYFTTTKGKLFRLPYTADGKQKPEALGAFKALDKITLVEDIYVSISYSDINMSKEWLEQKYLPNKVSAIMGDNTMQQLVVSWDKNPKNVKFKDGVYTYKGTIVGYDKTINLYMSIASEMLNDTNQILFSNNAGRTDTVEVNDKGTGSSAKRLQEGDIVSVYKDRECKSLLGKGIVNRERIALISNLDLDPTGRSFYVTIKRGGKAESKPTEVCQLDAPLVNPLNGKDVDYVGLGIDGRDFRVESWIPSRLSAASGYNKKSQFVYILKSGTRLDMRNQTPVEELRDLTFSGPWQGRNYMIRDSAAKPSFFNKGNYDVYISAGIEGRATGDVAGKQPYVFGKIANEEAVKIAVTEEALPAKPSTTDIYARGNAEIVLPKAPQKGEVAWIAPSGLKWVAETGKPSPFEPLVSEGKATFLIGDGTTRNIKLPVTQSIDFVYKLYIVNAAGASPESDRAIAIDSTNPIIDSPISNVVTVNAGDPILNVRCKNKQYVIVYLLPDVNRIDTVEFYEDMYKKRQANKVELSNGQALPVETKGLYFSTSQYVLIAVDRAGNISQPVVVTINRDTTRLARLITIANQYRPTSNTPEDLKKWSDLQREIQKAQTVFDNLRSTQAEIDTAYKNLDFAYSMISNDADYGRDVQLVNSVLSTIDIRSVFGDIFNVNGRPESYKYLIGRDSSKDVYVRWETDSKYVTIVKSSDAGHLDDYIAYVTSPPKGTGKVRAKLKAYGTKGKAIDIPIEFSIDISESSSQLYVAVRFKDGINSIAPYTRSFKLEVTGSFADKPLDIADIRLRDTISGAYIIPQIVTPGDYIPNSNTRIYDVGFANEFYPGKSYVLEINRPGYNFDVPVQNLIISNLIVTTDIREITKQGLRIVFDNPVYDLKAGDIIIKKGSSQITLMDNEIQPVGQDGREYIIYTSLEGGSDYSFNIIKNGFNFIGLPQTVRVSDTAENIKFNILHTEYTGTISVTLQLSKDVDIRTAKVVIKEIGGPEMIVNSGDILSDPSHPGQYTIRAAMYSGKRYKIVIEKLGYIFEPETASGDEFTIQ